PQGGDGLEDVAEPQSRRPARRRVAEPVRTASCGRVSSVCKGSGRGVPPPLSGGGGGRGGVGTHNRRICSPPPPHPPHTRGEGAHRVCRTGSDSPQRLTD